jgi:DNA-binding transcriptional ArsR family regulator
MIVKCMQQDARKIDLKFLALSEPIRRAMLDRLVEGPRTAGELVQPLKVTLSGVVQHLQLLETSGLVRSEKIGRVRSWRIEPEGLRAVEQWLAQRRGTWERHLGRLGEYLDQQPDQGSPS